MNRRYLIASAAVIVMTASVMPKPAPTPTEPSIKTTCVTDAECKPIVPDQTRVTDIPNLNDMYPPCEDEDQIVPACVWDARDHGNGKGMSWYVDENMVWRKIDHV